MAVLDVDKLDDYVSKEELDMSEFVNDVKETILELKNKYTRKDKETLKYKSVVKKLGYDNEQYGDLDTFIEDIKAKQTKASIADEAIQTKSQVEERIALLEKKLAEKEEQERRLVMENNVKTIKDKLNDAIGDKLIASKLVINDVINSGKAKVIDGEVVFTNGDDVVLFDEGIETLIKEHEDLLKVNQKSGSGSTFSNNRSNVGKLTLEDVNNMSKEEISKNINEIKQLVK